MQTVTELLALLQRSHILAAIRLLDDGEKTAFAESRKSASDFGCVNAACCRNGWRMDVSDTKDVSL